MGTWTANSTTSRTSLMVMLLMVLCVHSDPPLEDGSQDSAIYAYNPGHLKFWETGVTNQS